jgi:hypothetical protein
MVLSDDEERSNFGAVEGVRLLAFSGPEMEGEKLTL